MRLDLLTMRVPSTYLCVACQFTNLATMRLIIALCARPALGSQLRYKACVNARFSRKQAHLRLSSDPGSPFSRFFYLFFLF